MRPYLTVIFDSFHEAFASRVLYILLLVLTLVLIFLAPLTYTESRAVNFSRMSVPSIPVFLTQLREQDAAEEPSPGKRLVEMADKPFQDLVRGAGEGEGKESEPITRISGKEVNVFVHGMNELLKKKDLYDAEVWKDARLGDEAKELLEQGPDNLPAEQLAVLNRLLLHGAFPMSLGTVPNEELYIRYAWLTLPEPLPFPKEMFTMVVKLTLSAFMNFFVGTIAIFVAILVTAPIMPRTFEAGAIDLLLSKPISRSLLVIAKYLGGCAFIFLCVTYFIVGLWLIMGWRFDLWSQPLLLCIPVFMFQFAIYYAVSVLAGVIWRNPIVSIVVTVLFFLACFSIGLGKSLIEQSAINPSRLVRLVSTDEALVGVTQVGNFVQWNAAQEDWEDVLQTSRRRGGFAMVMESVLVGPVYHQPTQELLYLEQPAGPRRFRGGGGEFKKAKWTGNWVASSGPSPPTGASWILQDKDNHVLIVTSTGVYLYQPEGAAKKANILGFKIPLGGDKTYSRLGPDKGLPYTTPFAAALDRDSNRVLIDNKGTLYLLGPGEDGQYAIDQEVEREEKGAAVVGLSSKFAVVADEKGHIELRDAQSLEVKHTFRPAGNSAPNVIEVSPDGNYIAVLFHDGLLWLYDSAAEQGRRIDSDASAVAFDEDQILIADAKTRVRIENLSDGQTVATYSPQSSTLRLAYDWIIQPVYFLFPKPGELSNVVEYLLTDESSQSLVAGPASSGDLREVRGTVDIMTPMIHNAIFICVMLGITCFYVSRLDL